MLRERVVELLSRYRSMNTPVMMREQVVRDLEDILREERKDVSARVEYQSGGDVADQSAANDRHQHYGDRTSS